MNPEPFTVHTFEETIYHRYSIDTAFDEGWVGGFSQVFPGTRPNSAQHRKSDIEKRVACKRIPYEPHKRANVAREVEITQLMSGCAFSVRYIADHEDIHNRVWYLITELAPGGNLSYRTSHDATALPENVIWCYLAQLASVLCYIHQAGYCHNDVKPANIFLHYDGNIRLADYGFCVKMDDAGQAVSVGGTMGFYAPETLDTKITSPQSEAYSLGIVMFYVMSKRNLFYDCKTADEIRIKMGRLSEVERELPHQYSEQLRRTVASLLIEDPKERLSLAKAIYIPQIQNVLISLSNVRMLKAEAEIVRVEEMSLIKRDSLKRDIMRLKERLSATSAQLATCQTMLIREEDRRQSEGKKLREATRVINRELERVENELKDKKVENAEFARTLEERNGDVLSLREALASSERAMRQASAALRMRAGKKGKVTFDNVEPVALNWMEAIESDIRLSEHEDETAKKHSEPFNHVSRLYGSLKATARKSFIGGTEEETHARLRRYENQSEGVSDSTPLSVDRNAVPPGEGSSPGTDADKGKGNDFDLGNLTPIPPIRRWSRVSTLINKFRS